MGHSGYAFEPSENGAGVRWVSASAESWSGSFQSNGSGASAHLAGAYDASVDTTNGAGVLALIGLLDGIRDLLEETPTATMTVDGPTVTFTPSNTLGGPTTDTPTGTFTATLTPDGPTFTFTPTNTLGGPTETQTATFTVTNTPGGPELTPTVCVPADSVGDCDLNNDGEIDALDLILILESILDGTGNSFDFDCDGATTDRDLIRFSEKWGEEVP